MIGVHTGANAHCLMCRDKYGNPTTDMALSQLEHLLQGVPEIELKQRMNWGIHLRCRYGISCSSLHSKESEYKRRAEQLESRVRWVAREGTDEQVYMVLHILQGTFPQVYREVEVEHHKAVQKGAK